MKTQLRLQLTHSPWLIDEDTEPAVSADPRGRKIPRGKLGSNPGLPTGHLFPPETAPVPLLPDVAGGAAAPVALLFLTVRALWFRRARTSCCSRGRGAGRRSSVCLRVRVGAETLEIDQLAFLLIRELEFPQ